jgi:hypothetical protein
VAERRDLTLRAAELMREIGVPLLSTHVGFVPTSSAAEYATIIERLRESRRPGDDECDLLMETGRNGARSCSSSSTTWRARTCRSTSTRPT